MGALPQEVLDAQARLEQRRQQEGIGSGPRPIGEARPGPQAVTAQPKAQLPEPENRDTLCEFGDLPIHLPCNEVEAKCVKITEAYFGPWKQTKLVFHFEVFHPIEYGKTQLQMFVRIDPKWKGKPPLSSKLRKIAAVALGGNPRRQKITKSLFVGALFKCKLKHVGEGATVYTFVETILERLAS